jgi:hypothetical protein
MPRVPPESATSVQAAPRFSARRTGAPSGTAALLTDFWQLLAAQHIYDTVAADAALQNNRASRAAFYFSDTHRTFGDRNLFKTSSTLPSCASGTKTAKRPSFATYKRSSPRISQALCTVSCTGIRASSSLMQMFRSAGISFNVVVQKPVPGTSAGTTPHIARIPCTLRCRWRFCRLLLRSPSSLRFLTLRPRTVPPEDATTLSFHSSRKARCENQDARSRSELWLARESTCRADKQPHIRSRRSEPARAR